MKINKSLCCVKKCPVDTDIKERFSSLCYEKPGGFISLLWKLPRDAFCNQHIHSPFGITFIIRKSIAAFEIRNKKFITGFMSRT